MKNLFDSYLDGEILSNIQLAVLRSQLFDACEALALLKSRTCSHTLSALAQESSSVYSKLEARQVGYCKSNDTVAAVKVDTGGSVLIQRSSLDGSSASELEIKTTVPSTILHYQMAEEIAKSLSIPLPKRPNDKFGGRWFVYMHRMLPDAWGRLYNTNFFCADFDSLMKQVGDSAGSYVDNCKELGIPKYHAYICYALLLLTNTRSDANISLMDVVNIYYMKSVRHVLLELDREVYSEN